MVLIALSILLFFGPAPDTYAEKPSHAADDRGARDVLTGTVESINPDKIVVKTDIGRAEPITIKNPALLQDIHQGDRISIELDDRHVATKITRVAPPELPNPPAETGY
ncbi:MAG TPA: hypothetical protein VHQ67_01790 [Nitrospiraceae bacterium]|jgi:hypothetical protein|nr:hypothetical protein [Nitrospiraceae bacterium]